jgi:hypothetical protein
MTMREAVATCDNDVDVRVSDKMPYMTWKKEKWEVRRRRTKNSRRSSGSASFRVPYTLFMNLVASKQKICIIRYLRVQSR